MSTWAWWWKFTSLQFWIHHILRLKKCGSSKVKQAQQALGLELQAKILNNVFVNKNMKQLYLNDNNVTIKPTCFWKCKFGINLWRNCWARTSEKKLEWSRSYFLNTESGTSCSYYYLFSRYKIIIEIRTTGISNVVRWEIHTFLIHTYVCMHLLVQMYL